MPKSKRHESDYPAVSTYTRKGFTRMWNEKAEREREAWRLRREELHHPQSDGFPEPPEAA